MEDLTYGRHQHAHIILPSPTPPAPRSPSIIRAPTVAAYALSVISTTACISTMITRLLEEGHARVEETLAKGYAPSHFSRNLELILVEDNRSSTSLSMKTKIASTGERAACLRTMEPLALIWWAAAFPMRQWSGGRKMSSTIFESLVRHAPAYVSQAAPLLTVVADDLNQLGQRYPHYRMLQDFLECLCQQPSPRPVSLYGSSPIDRPDSILFEERQYIRLSGARQDYLTRLPDLLRHGIEGSRTYQEEKRKAASISTALTIHVPTDPNEDDSYVIVPIGTMQVWDILQELGMIE